MEKCYKVFFFAILGYPSFSVGRPSNAVVSHEAAPGDGGISNGTDQVLRTAHLHIRHTEVRTSDCSNPGPRRGSLLPSDPFPRRILGSLPQDGKYEVNFYDHCFDSSNGFFFAPDIQFKSNTDFVSKYPFSNGILIIFQNDNNDFAFEIYLVDVYFQNVNSFSPISNKKRI